MPSGPELTADSADHGRSARRFDDALDLLDEIWAGGAIEHESEPVTLPASVFEARPVRRPRPPIYLAAYTPAGRSRIARRADGWPPTGMPIAALAGMRRAIAQMAADVGRDPAEIGCIVRANVHLGDGTFDGGDRPDFCGALRQVTDDVKRCADIEVDAVSIDVQFSAGGDHRYRYLDYLEQFAALIHHSVPA
jgi:hypothetical protein